MNNFIIKPFYGFDNSTAVKTYMVVDVVYGSIFYIGTYKECDIFTKGNIVMGFDSAIEGGDQTVMCEYENGVLNRSYKV